MKQSSIGISDIQIYTPSPRLDLGILVEKRTHEEPKLKRHLERALRVTGQKAIRFPTIWEDTSTLAASSAYRLIKANNDLDLSGLRYIAVGTESSVDHSKPISSFVEGMLQNAGLEIPESLSSFQVQHACAAGTLALMSVSALLATSGRDNESGLVIASDIARYSPGTTAEVTQGAGSVSLLVEKNPKLIELDLQTPGYCSKDVDDFFRPLGSKTAVVNGTYSMQIYKESLESAFLDHCARKNESPRDVLLNTDIVVLHTPFRNLPEMAMKSLLAKYLDYDEEQASNYLSQRGMYHGIDAVAEIGNIYTGSLFMSLAFILNGKYHELDGQIAGKSVLMASYGSGSTMAVLGGRISEEAASVISRWELNRLFQSASPATFDEYLQWVEGPYEPTGLNMTPVQLTANLPFFSLNAIREDGYREYSFRESVVNENQKGKTPVNLYRIA